MKYYVVALGEHAFYRSYGTRRVSDCAMSAAWLTRDEAEAVVARESGEIRPAPQEEWDTMLFGRPNAD